MRCSILNTKIFSLKLNIFKKKFREKLIYKILFFYNVKMEENIEKLVLNNFDGELVLPETLKHLELNFSLYPYDLKLPKGLKYLKLKCIPKSIKLPNRLEQLYFYYGKSDIIDFPRSLTHLQLPFRYPHKLPELPNLKYLSIGPECPNQIYLNDGLEEFHVNSCLKLDAWSDEIRDETPIFTLNKIPDSLHTLQLPLQVYQGELQAELDCLNDFTIDNYLQNFPNLKNVHCYDETFGNDDEIKDFFKENSQITLKSYYSNYIEDYSGYDEDDNSSESSEY